MHFFFPWNRHWHQSPSFCRNISQSAFSSPDRYTDDVISPTVISEWKSFDKSQIAKAFVPLILPNLCTENMLQQNEIQERKEHVCLEEREWFKQQKGHSQISLEFKNPCWPKGHLGIEGKLKTSGRKVTKKLFCMKIPIPLIIMHWNKRCKTVLQQDLCLMHSMHTVSGNREFREPCFSLYLYNIRLWCPQILTGVCRPYRNNNNNNKNKSSYLSHCK